MNTSTTHVVEGSDLPAYESGLTDSGYLHLGGGVKVTIADRHVEYLRQLVIAAEGAIQRIEARTPKMPTDPEPELQHPGTWLPGDQISTTSAPRWIWKFNGERWPCISHPGSGYLTTWNVDSYVGEGSDGSVHITHLVPRTNEVTR